MTLIEEFKGAWLELFSPDDCPLLASRLAVLMLGMELLGGQEQKLRSEGRVTEVTTSMWKIERSEEGNVAIAQQGRELLEVRSER